MVLIPTDPADDLEEAVRNLTSQMVESDTKVENLTIALRRRSVVFIFAIAAAAVLLAVAISAAYRVSLDNRRTIERNNSQFCGFLSANASTDPPPSTPRGAALQAAASKLYMRFHCSDAVNPSVIAEGSPK